MGGLRVLGYYHRGHAARGPFSVPPLVKTRPWLGAGISNDNLPRVYGAIIYIGSCTHQSLTSTYYEHTYQQVLYGYECLLLVVLWWFGALLPAQ